MTHGVAANLPETTKCAMNHQHGLHRCVRKSGIIPCIKCPTEYQFSLEESEIFGVAAIITKWMDLGEGWTILDPRWFTRLSNEYPLSNVFQEVDGINRRRLVERDLIRSNHVSIGVLFERDRSSRLDPILPLETAARLFRSPRGPIF